MHGESLANICVLPGVDFKSPQNYFLLGLYIETRRKTKHNHKPILLSISHTAKCFEPRLLFTYVAGSISLTSFHASTIRHCGRRWVLVLVLVVCRLESLVLLLVIIITMVISPSSPSQATLRPSPSLSASRAGQ